MASAEINHPRMQTISAQRFEAGADHRIGLTDLLPGVAPGPLRLQWDNFREPFWRREFSPVIIEWVEETDRIIVPDENIIEGPFVNAGLRLMFTNKRGEEVEDTPTIAISQISIVYAQRALEKTIWRKAGYFVNPRSLKKEEAAIVELGSEEYASHKKAEKNSYVIPPLKLFRQIPTTGVF